MKTLRIFPLIASAVLAAGLVLPAGASARTHGHVRIDARVVVSFKLHVSGAPSTETTFWVAYGPASGSFGLIRLRPGAHGLFTAARSFPASARLDLVYIAGHGVIHTRFGPAPGNPVVTIRALPESLAGRIEQPEVRWRAPTG